MCILPSDGGGGRIVVVCASQPAVVHRRISYLHACNEREERELMTRRLIFKVSSSASFLSVECTQTPN